MFGAVDDVVLQVGGHVAEVRAVPGHTDDQVAIAVRVLLGGEQGVIRLVKAYIEALKTLPGAQRLRSLYPEDLSKYELRMTEFLSTWLGGPALYQERHGMPMLRESHRSFAIDGEARDEWMLCMRTALRETVSDEELRLYLEGAFWRMADSLRTK